MQSTWECRSMHACSDCQLCGTYKEVRLHLGEPGGLSAPLLAKCRSREKAAVLALCCTGRSVAYRFMGREAILLISASTSRQSFCCMVGHLSMTCRHIMLVNGRGKRSACLALPGRGN